MDRLTKWTLILLLLTGAGSSLAQDQGEPPQLEGELRPLIDSLFSSVEEGDDAGLDAATCLAEAVRTQLSREEALGLVSDGAAPDLVARRQEEAREAVYGFVEEVLDRGQQVERIDTARVEVFPAGEDGETVQGESEETLAITASGVVGIKMLATQGVVDVVVTRFEDRWCIDPLSMR